tara:strand:- start:92904 stop:93530 length:627 start_codon:yes stop_codon:yes gene_type:complete
MKDPFNASTGELPIPERKKPGRPGKQVTDKNFFDVLEYFKKQKAFSHEKSESLDVIYYKAPSLYSTGSYVKGQIKEIDAKIKLHEQALARIDLGTTMSDWYENTIKELKSNRERLVQKQCTDVPALLIVSLQAWVDKWVSADEWRKCLNLAAKKRSSRSKKRAQIPFSMDVFKKMKSVKARAKKQSWDSFLLDMLSVYEAKLKRESKY